MANIAEPDKTLCSTSSDLGLLCLPVHFVGHKYSWVKCWKLGIIFTEMFPFCIAPDDRGYPHIFISARKQCCE